MVSNCPQLIRPNRNPGLPTHDFHQDPDAPVGRDLFHLCHEIGKWSLGQRHLIAGLQEPGWQQLALRIAAKHQLRDQVQRYGRWFLAKAHQPRDAIGRVDRVPEPAGHIEGHEDVTREQWPHGGDELAVPLARLLFHRQESLEALALEVRGRGIRRGRLQRDPRL